MDATRHTCLKLDLIGDDPNAKNSIFVKGTWFPSHFELSITDGLHAWTCKASEMEVKQRAEQWDQPVAEYIDMAERYLGFQHPGSIYRFEDAGNGQTRLSFTFEKQQTKLEWRWKCQPSSNDKQITVAILDFLMDANIRLSEEIVRKKQTVEKLETEAKKCLEQSERLANEKINFENDTYGKFVSLLNSKKAKLRELRDRIAKLEFSRDHQKVEENSTDKTESFDEESDGESDSEVVAAGQPGSSKSAAASSSKVPKRKATK